MNALYKSRGAAAEYLPGKGWSMRGPYSGCAHACRYCYVPDVTWQRRSTFHAQATPREHFLRQLKSAAVRLERAGDHGPVFMSFTCDPWQPVEAEHLLARKVLGICARYRLQPIVLTKGALVGQDLDALRLCPEPWLGITITSLDPVKARLWEPNAATPEERVAIAERAKLLGLRVWVSLEPVIYPEHTLAAIEALAGLVDHFAVGKLNHMTLGEVRRVDPEITRPVNWARFLAAAVRLLEAKGYQESPINCPDAAWPTFYIKADLRKAAQRGQGR